jgi:hypothetical protein
MHLRSLGLVAASLSLVAQLAGPASARPATTADSREGGSAVRTVCPLTGRRPASGVKVSRAAIAVKVDNTPGRNEQTGLERADVVIEQPVEGGLTRFTAIFHCKDASGVGPVRSARHDDPKVIQPLSDVLVYAGANEAVAEKMSASDIISVTEEDGDALYRTPDAVAPFDLFADTAKIRADVADAGGPAQRFRFGPLPRNLRRVTDFDLDFAGGTEVSYRWKDGAWRRGQDGAAFLDANSRPFSIANVLVQEVDVDNSNELFDALGNPSPEMTLRGTGRAFLFRDGRVIPGQWRSEDGLVRFLRKDGSRMPFDVGQTWWELIPSSEGDVNGAVRF